MLLPKLKPEEPPLEEVPLPDPKLKPEEPPKEPPVELDPKLNPDIFFMNLVCVKVCTLNKYVSPNKETTGPAARAGKLSRQTNARRNEFVSTTLVTSVSESRRGFETKLKSLC